MNLLTMLRRSAPTVPDVDIARLPDPTFTRRERAWSTLWYIEGHRGEWNQKHYGKFTDLSRVKTEGCFAHHLVKAAGYEEFGCYADTFERYMDIHFREACCYASARGTCSHADWVKTERGWEVVSTVARRLLGIDDQDGYDLSGKLFEAGNSLRDLRRILPKLVGPEPKNRR